MAFKEKDKSKHDKIIEGAIKVFAKKGFYNAKVSEIAREANVADGTIYLYFKNKDDILISLFEEKVDLIITRMEEELAKVDEPTRQNPYLCRTPPQAGQREQAPFRSHPDRIAAVQQIHEALSARKIPRVPESHRKNHRGRKKKWCGPAGCHPCNSKKGYFRCPGRDVPLLGAGKEAEIQPGTVH
jgi:AcrR family transcriptional regulator